MPLSKKRMAEYQQERRDKLKIVIPKLGIVIPNDEFHWRDQGVQPIPNRPDGSYRE